MQRSRLFLIISIASLVTLSCGLFSQVAPPAEPTQPPAPTHTPISLPAAPVQPGETNPDEPVFISGDIPYTSRFFLSTIAQPFVMLEDEAGFVRRDRDFQFPLAGQAIGPVEINEDDTLTYSLSLPSIPQGTFVDVDNNGKQDAGVQVFAVAYWSNTWGDPFLEKRDGTGWSTAYASTITDPNNEYEIIGGTLVVWAPDDQQAFPTGFGADGLLFTADDPSGPIPAGYNLVDLNAEPFQFYKEALPNLPLIEGVGAVNDYSEQDYAQAFQSLFAKVSREYPFTKEKNIDWAALEQEFTPRFEDANSHAEFYSALRDFSLRIPDGHVGISLDQDLFREQIGGGLGLVLEELSDGRVVVTEVIPNTPGEGAGLQPGAEIVSWQGAPVADAIAKVEPFFGHFSTSHTRRIEQVNYLTRMPVGTRLSLTFKNPGAAQAEEIELQAAPEIDSLLRTSPSYNLDGLALPIQAYTLPESGLGYMRINNFGDDMSLMASTWERYIQNLIDAEVPGLIIDLRANSGGDMGMVKNFLGYFFDQEIELYHSLYYNEDSGQFEPAPRPVRIEPAPLYYDKPIAVLVSPNCISACEGFAYALQQNGRAVIVGHHPTAGAFGEVGRGQYKLPEDINMQFPTGRPENTEGQVIIEGMGVIPDQLVPVTLESALGQVDALLEAAVEALK